MTQFPTSPPFFQAVHAPAGTVGFSEGMLSFQSIVASSASPKPQSIEFTVKEVLTYSSTSPAQD